MMMETKACSKCKALKPISEFHKNSRSKAGFHSQCKPCVAEYSSKYYLKNSEERKSYDKKYREENVEKLKISKRMYQQNNRGKVNAITYKRRAGKIQRTPKWLTPVDLFEIECAYTYCAALRKVGLEYEVDHVIPLQGKKASGLHVPANLVVIPKLDNRRKHNKFEVFDAN